MKLHGCSTGFKLIVLYGPSHPGLSHSSYGAKLEPILEPTAVFYGTNRVIFGREGGELLGNSMVGVRRFALSLCFLFECVFGNRLGCNVSLLFANNGYGQAARQSGGGRVCVRGGQHR